MRVDPLERRYGHRNPAEDEMRIRVLGPVDIWRDGRSMPVVGLKQRTLLAVLTLEANRVVSHDRLLTALWGAKVPVTGRRLLHNHLWSLRRLLTAGGELVSTTTGYSLRLETGASDLEAFLTGTADARLALSEGDAVRAAEMFRSVLSLWRGPALGGTQPDFQAIEGAALEDLRIAALAERIEADLTLERHAELVGELRLLVAEHPLNEALRGRLMLALYRTGRTAEALEEFRVGRRRFRDDLGLDPGEEISRIHQAILTGGSADVATTDPVSHVPRQLPADITRFVGRVEDLKRLDALLPENQGTGVIISAVAGTPGVGKTALVTRWGHRAVSRFTDGQLYVNLHGYSRGRPVTAAQALDQLLRGLGVADDEIPQEIDERAALYRSTLANRKVLIVLDNVATSDQVRPLLPGSSCSRVIITSRDSLRGLSVTHDLDSIVLGVLSPEDAITLLTMLVRDRRTVDEPEALAELAELCGYLPLALRLAAAQLFSQPVLRIGELAAKLRAENRLTVLELAEDPGVGVRAALELSYQSLPESARRTFRLLGVHPGPDVSIEAVAALTGAPLLKARAVVEALTNAHLLQVGPDVRLSMHDLVRVYAQELGEADGVAGEREAALSRMLDWYWRAVSKAIEQVAVLDAHVLNLTHAAEVPDFTSTDEAMAWLETERHSLVATTIRAVEWGVHSPTWQISCCLGKFLYMRNHLDHWLTTAEKGVSEARLAGDLRGEAVTVSNLGYALMFTGRYQENLRHQQRALELWHTIGDPVSEAKALRDVSYGLQLIGELTQAIEIGEQALALSRQIDDQMGVFIAKDNLALSYFRTGHLGKALENLLECQEYWRQEGRVHDEAYGLLLLAPLYIKLGDLTNAMDCFQQAMSLNYSKDNLRVEVEALNGIGMVLRHQERYTEAVEHHERALDLTRRIRNRQLESEVLNDLGDTCFVNGDSIGALECYREAAVCADEANHVYQRGFSRRGLGRALHALGRTDEAKVRWREALEILGPTGVPEAEEVAGWMREIGV
ncbi:AfsR/SARP family transcriptional regulator [Streptosporangium saharense]|uniref:AfsR/SARP family transcriptional regulator n=1 Tax=Streptosporangium saharense TaxID=1706840 RepID=UPI0036C50181